MLRRRGPISLTVSEQNGQVNALKKHHVSGMAAKTVGLTVAFCQCGRLPTTELIGRRVDTSVRFAKNVYLESYGAE